MSDDIHIRVEGKAGRITLNRPDALNAMTYEMCMAIDAALIKWRDFDPVQVVVIDAVGNKAFCAGGDIAQLYNTGRAGDFGFGQKFWRDEYQMNARIAAYPKLIISFMQGFTMGGGVGLGCHAQMRIVGETSKIALPECGIGLVPDVGGSNILAAMNRQDPGLGTWVGACGARLSAGDARFGFASHFVPEDRWDTLKEQAVGEGCVDLKAMSSPNSDIPFTNKQMSGHFNQVTMTDVVASLKGDTSVEAQSALKSLNRACPLSVVCHFEILRRLDKDSSIKDALKLEYRFVYRCMQHGDFLEGIRAQIIDKDRAPKWRHASINDVTQGDVDKMLAPLGADELSFGKAIGAET